MSSKRNDTKRPKRDTSKPAARCSKAVNTKSSDEMVNKDLLVKSSTSFKIPKKSQNDVAGVQAECTKSDNSTGNDALVSQLSKTEEAGSLSHKKSRKKFADPTNSATDLPKRAPSSAKKSSSIHKKSNSQSTVIQPVTKQGKNISAKSSQSANKANPKDVELSCSNVIDSDKSSSSISKTKSPPSKAKKIIKESALPTDHGDSDVPVRASDQSRTAKRGSKRLPNLKKAAETVTEIPVEDAKSSGRKSSSRSKRTQDLELSAGDGQELDACKDPQSKPVSKQRKSKSANVKGVDTEIEDNTEKVIASAKRGRPSRKKEVKPAYVEKSESEDDTGVKDKLPVKKRRGRPANTDVEKKGSNNDNADFSTPKANKSIKGKRGRKPKTKQEPTCAEDESQVHESQPLQCKHCEFSADVNHKMKFHYASVHTLLYSKSAPEGTDDPQSLILIAKILGGKLTCPHCNKAIKTPGYYKQHLKLCTSDRSEKTVCKMCKKEVIAFWIHQHEVNCVKKMAVQAAEELKAEAKRQEKALLNDNTTSSGKRRAAAKARNVIKDMSKEHEEVNWNDLFTTPQMTVPSEENLKRWKLNEGENEMITCSHEGCIVQHKTIEEMTEHYWTCTLNGLSNHTWNCKQCPQKFTSEERALSHVKSHKSKRKRKCQDDAEYKSDGQSNSEDDNITSGAPSEEDDEAVSVSGEEGEDIEKPSKSSGKDSKFHGNYTSFSLPSSFSPTKLCNSLHGDAPYRISTLLPAKEDIELCEDYQVMADCSLRFTIDSSSAVHELKAGKSMEHTNGHVLYIGKPIKLVAWCPVPRKSQKLLAGDQFFAVVLDSEDSRDLRNTYSATGTVSIWRISDLNKKTSHTKMMLSLNLRHNFGSIHQMRWCGDGGFIVSHLDNGVDRLGLIALACSDGCVHIASVPFLPQTTHHKEDLTSSYSIVGSLTLCVDGNTAQCTCVEWQRQDTKFIVAGFSDGSVALWYVGGEIQSGTLQSIKVFRSHTSLITSVNWCPFSPDLFATFSHGWFVWDIKDLSSPYFTPKVSDWCMDMHTKAVWPRLYHIMVSCTDPSFGSPSLMLSPFGYEMILGNQKSPVRDLLHTTDVDVCDCSDMIVVSDSSGTVGWSTTILPKYFKGSEKPFNKCTALSTSKSSLDESSHVWKFEYLVKMKQTTSGAKANLCDAKTLMENNRECAISSISMNPNSEGHGWLLCGGYNGLLHVMKLE